MDDIINRFFRAIDWHVSFSGGKDSTATVLIAQHYHISIQQLDIINMRFDDNINGKLPEDYDFMMNMLYRLELPYTILNCKTYVDYYNRTVYKSKYIGRMGLITGAACAITGSCEISRDKIQLLHNITKKHTLVGIASDETIRLKRLQYPKYSLLGALNITEKRCYGICKRHNMLLPLYNTVKREGCWFCPNASYSQIQRVKEQYPTLYNRYTEMILDTPPVYRNLLESRHNWMKFYKDNK